jgi:hypothetical protein
MYRWIIFLHVVSAIIFFMAHGVSIGVALRLHRERQPERLRPLLELSSASRMAVNGSLLMLLLTGVIGGFMLNWWRMGWIWVSLLLLVLLSVAMMRGMSPHFNALRKAVGSPYSEKGKRYAAQEPASDAEIEHLLQSAQQMRLVAAVGVAITIIILYLMMFKPF